jgi:hypothetical protein
MNRWIRSIGRALGAPAKHVNQPAAAPAARVMMSEPLEGRVMMAAQLSASSMIDKLVAANASSRATLNVPVGPTGGVLDGDDRTGNASRVSLEFNKSGEISYAMDVDLYKFTARKGDRIGFDVDLPAGSTLDPVLRLFDASGRQMGRNDDAYAELEDRSVETRESFIAHTFATAGTYYVGVSGSGNSNYSPITGFGDAKAETTGKYQVKGKTLLPVDTNDQLSEAELVTVGSLISGKLDAGDVDVYKIAVTADQVLCFDVELDGVATPAATTLRLFDANGEELARNDDGLSPADEENYLGESFIKHRFESAGFVYVAVSGRGNDTYDVADGTADSTGAVGRYSLQIQLPKFYKAL